MKDTEYENIIEVTNDSNVFVPFNEKAVELNEQTKNGEVLTFKEITPRDIARHRGYFDLLRFIYDYLPQKFHKVVDIKYFYKWIKHLKKQYKVIFRFKDAEKSKEIVNELFKHKEDLKLTPGQIEKIAMLLGYSEMLEYDSISFSRMTDPAFKEYIKNQLPFIYENVVGKFFKDTQYDDIIDTIEQEYLRFLIKL